MEASILDLRKNMKKVMSALERNERVTPPSQDGGYRTCR